MRAYELMVIIDGRLEDAAAQSWVKTLNDGIKNAGGSIHGKADFWGRRKLAYPIKKSEDGYYVVMNVLAAPGKLDDFERTLRISDDILRHKLFRLPDAEASRRGMVDAAA